MASVLKPLLRELAERYRAHPEEAVAETRAVCDSTPGDPLKWSVVGSPALMKELQVGQHPALGGDGSAPCPGELLAVAMASCMDGTIRSIADLIELRLDSIRVEVVNRGDVREFVRLLDAPAPPDTGISMTVDVRVRKGEDSAKVATLRAAAEGGSAVLNLVRSGAPVSVSWTSPP